MVLLSKYGVLVSEDGSVYRERDGYQYKPYREGKVGYVRYSVTDHETGKWVSRSAHQLVALAYIPNPENKPCVNHKDGDKSNNHVSNLEWCTHKENTRHGIETGLISLPPEKFPIRTRAVKDLYSLGWTTIEIAELFMCSQPNIVRILKKKSS